MNLTHSQLLETYIIIVTTQIMSKHVNYGTQFL